MNFLKAGMHKLPEYMQLRQAVESNALPAVATDCPVFIKQL